MGALLIKPHVYREKVMPFTEPVVPTTRIAAMVIRNPSARLLSKPSKIRNPKWQPAIRNYIHNRGSKTSSNWVQHFFLLGQILHSCDFVFCGHILANVKLNSESLI